MPFNAVSTLLSQPVANVAAFWPCVPLPATATELHSCLAPVSAGFPSPAEDSLEERIDLNRLLVRHPAATFFVRVEGDSMIGAGIFDGDVLIVDRALPAQDGDIVVARVDDGFCVKRLQTDEDGIWLVPENEAFAPLHITPERDFAVWGRVLHVIHTFRRPPMAPEPATAAAH